ncbi:LysR substrate-binding domain-containing protein [Serratia fonticola]|uniref:LysR substrate-binding domain-containing protein n=1 Tax=Serratia fonticola TaxID=47917 RepID=UPI00192D17E2|nr:LysR substrate-binding domain-containing protein [Serratia fonticola]MBL5825701.1 LysR family transcriptional regulator [Serratia fonticola]
MKELPKTNQLRNFQAIIRYGSIRAAAQALFQSQPAMTKSIQELERILGVDLLSRGAHGIILTKMGCIFESRVNTILNDLERAVDELNQLSEENHGSVAFGCSHLPAFSVLPALINKFQEDHLASNITIIEGQFSELITSIRLGRLDFFMGIATPEISMNEFSIENSISAEFCIIARNGHPLSNCRSLIELKGAKWYFPNTNTGYYNNLEKFIFPKGRDGNEIVIYGDSITIGEQLVLNEDYLFVGPKAILDIPHMKNIISAIPIEEKLPDALYILLYRKQQGLTPLARSLMDEINQACSNLLSRVDK